MPMKELWPMDPKIIFLTNNLSYDTIHKPSPVSFHQHWMLAKWNFLWQQCGLATWFFNYLLITERRFCLGYPTPIFRVFLSQLWTVSSHASASMEKAQYLLKEIFTILNQSIKCIMLNQVFSKIEKKIDLKIKVDKIT